MFSQMVDDILIQIGLVLLVVVTFLFIHSVPQKVLANLRLRLKSKSGIQSKRHFVLGAQLLAQARSASSKSSAASLSKQALDEADKAIALDPKDAAAHILKALALDVQGFKTSALDAIDVALSPLCRKSLVDAERGDALLKRAEIKMSMNRPARLDSVIEDLTLAVKLSPENAKAFCSLGECYEEKKMTEEAKKAYEEALKLHPRFAAAKEALDRLGPS
ncbi:putative 43kDa postsynaptic protein [Rosa chinensis]|uniref:Putative 43kDa postsynaptic protein n=1 Tax=Rosa chinensis TaxID=74649 RepID=A0A2P6PGM5_ROSCH|nr:uncharacterized protein LOC112178300 [Rosa chinensis]PRQ21085.1 putative 43kDa postsynaptic protein [Rosa chinensis]